MSRNGAGVYTLPAGNPVITGSTISSTWANTTLTDLASALTSSIAVDGQSVITSNLPMAGFKLTGCAVGANAGEPLTFGQAVTATTGAFSAGISATTGTFAGALSATGLTLSGAFSGTSGAFSTGLTAPTRTFGDSTTNVATTAFVAAQAFSAALPAQAGNAAKYITTNGSAASWSHPITISATVKTGAYSAIGGDVFSQNTTGAAFTVTLPASPTATDPPILIADYAGTFGVNNLTIDPGSGKVEGFTGLFQVDLNRFRAFLTWIDSTQGWVFV